MTALSPLAITPAEKLAEFKKRKSEYYEDRKPLGFKEAMEGEGWSEASRTTKTILFQKRKDKWRILEDKVWRLCYHLGFDELSIGDKFYLPPQGSDYGKPRQVDVFAKDDEVVVIVECKSKENMEHKNVAPIINDLLARRQAMMNAVREHYGKDLKVITILATEGIQWTEEDKNEAIKASIHRISERELKYYLEIARTLGKAARYQFNAEFLKDQKIPLLRDLSYPAIVQKIGGHRAYIFSAPARDLIKVGFVNHRDLRDPSSAPSYQRMLSKKRLNEVSAFVDGDGYFANSILVSLSEGKKSGCQFHQKDRHPGSDIAFGILNLSPHFKSMRIIDGQHRLYGAAESQKRPDTSVVVVALVNLKEVEEAKLFKDINKEQKGVDPSLIGGLDGDLEWASEEPSKRLNAVASRIIDFVINDEDSVFGEVASSLTVAALRNDLVKSGLIGSVRANSKELRPGPLSGDTSEQSLERATDFLNWYFGEIKHSNLGLWSLDHNSGGGKKHGAVNSNVFVSGHMFFLAAVLRQLETKWGHFDDCDLKTIRNAVKPILESYCKAIATLSYADFMARFTVGYGGAGSEEMKNKIAVAVKSTQSDFTIPGLDKFESDTSVDRVKRACTLARAISDLTLRRVKQSIASTQNGDYWSNEISKELNKELFSRKANTNQGKGTHLENYLEFGDVRKHLSKVQKLWPALKPHIDIKTTASLGSTKHTHWMDTVARLASAKEVSKITDEEMDLINTVSSYLSIDLSNLHIA